MTPEGAGYRGWFEPFVQGKAFPVTDVAINKDGAMYITVGGRGTQSGLYRVTYTGDEVPPINSASSILRLRSNGFFAPAITTYGLS